MRFILLGAPGSGKRTQARLLVNKLSAQLISPLEIAKQAADGNDPVGLEVKSLMDHAHVVPDHLFVNLIRNHIGGLPADARFFFDGFPRSVRQANLLDEILTVLQRPLEAAIYLDVDRESLIERLTGRIVCNGCGAAYNHFSVPSSLGHICEYCGGELKRRGEEREAVIVNRLKGYQGQVASVLEYYRQQDLLRIINGVGDANDIFSSIASVFNLLPEALEAKDLKLTGTALIEAQERAKKITAQRAADAEAAARMQAQAAQKTQKKDKEIVKDRIIKPARSRVPGKISPVIKPPVQMTRAKKQKISRSEVQATTAKEIAAPGSKVKVELVKIEMISQSKAVHSGTDALESKKVAPKKNSSPEKALSKSTSSTSKKKTIVTHKKAVKKNVKTSASKVSSAATKGSSSQSVKPSGTKGTSTSKEAKPVKKRSTAKKKASTKKRVTAKKGVSTKKRGATTKKRAATKKKVGTKKRRATTKKKRATTKKKRASTKKKSASTKKRATTKKKRASTKKKSSGTKKRRTTTKKKSASTKKKASATKKKRGGARRKAAKK